MEVEPEHLGALTDLDYSLLLYFVKIEMNITTSNMYMYA